MTIKDLLVIISAASGEFPTDDITVILETQDGCWLEVNTLQFTEDGLGRECIVLSNTAQIEDEKKLN